MPLKQARLLIHQINNKLTGALGFIELAGDSEDTRKDYLGKATRELKEAVIVLQQLMGLVTSVATDVVVAAVDAAGDARKSAEDLSRKAEELKRAADEVTQKSAAVQKQLRPIIVPPPRVLTIPHPKKKK